jgi:hypothetical protein
MEALTDVIFSILGGNKLELERNLKANLDQFQSRFQIHAATIGPDPCQNYACPIGI